MLRRLGLNLLYLVPREVGGTEIAARRLVAALAQQQPELEIVVFCGREAGAELPDPAWPASVRIVTLPVEARRKPLRLAAELALLPAAARHHRVDLLHSYGTTAPLHGPPRVTTVHDLIYHHWPQAFPAPARAGLELVVPLAARRSRRVQVSSQATRDDVVRTLAIPAGRIDVVPLGRGMAEVGEPTAEAQLRERLDLGEATVVLSVAAALPHKNLDGLLTAFAALDVEPAPVLVLTGHAGRISGPLAARAQALGIADRVRFTGWIDAADVEGLYRLATAFAYPSLEEGFGMPVLEAMHRGLPVVCADATSLPEVAGDAALLVDGRDPAALAAALRRVCTEPELRADLVHRGRAQAARFDWSRTAQAALDSYERALADDRRA